MNVFFLISCCLLASISIIVQSKDTLKQGDSPNSSSQLVSPNNIFALGFYNSYESQTIYLAIWYRNGTLYGRERPVWIGNRNNPISNDSAVLTLDTSGKLIVRGKGGDFFELYSGQTSSSNTTATLLNNGNFMVRDMNSNGSVKTLLWQSFDHLTDTLLPGMKLGVNHKTGRNWTLTSWLTDSIPANGAFTLEWDPPGRHLMIRYRGVIHWSSGTLDGKEFEYIKPDEANLNVHFINVTNEDEDYFSYNLTKTAPEFVNYRNYISGWLLDYSGELSAPTGVTTIAPIEGCYGYKNRTSIFVGIQGCQSWDQPKCRNRYQKFDARSGGFSKKANGEYDPGHSDNNSSLSHSDCREMCWRNCDCGGFMGGDSTTGCVFWSRNTSKFEQSYSGTSPRQYVLIDEAPNKNADWKRILIVVVVAIISLVLFLIGGLCYLRGKTKQGKSKELLELMTLDGYTDTMNRKTGQDLKVFSYSCIAAATDTFSPGNKLGEGGFGPVYKGKLSEGQDVAVKRLSKRSGQGLLEFKTELILIAKLQHTNLVRLFGYCIHGDEKMLVYEYMPNKSLDFFLFDETRKKHLPWERRFSIIEGIAQGLLYLHKYSRLMIVHRDLKAGNILLDENMNPKISDFGTARIVKKNLLEANTDKISGTRGYMAPEYLMEGTFSTKSDVFSFGVLMLEIVSGRRNNSFQEVDGILNLVAYAWELSTRDAAIELMDRALVGSCTSHDQLLRCIQIGLLCAQHSANDRPTMSDVISMLSNQNSALPLPKTPAFVPGGNMVEGDQHKMKSDKISASGLTISTMDAR